jgi:XRE family aerobic/anaerobic benzoate catabolism transcriptional regulator
MNSEDFLRKLGHRVRARRLHRGLSQERLARAAGLSPRFLSQLESGQGNISVARLFELSRALSTPIEELLKSNDGRRQVIALIGLRGAGKTTIGKRLAKTLKRTFLELNQMIEEEAGLRLDEIFELHGEAYYRRLEQEVLRRFLSTSTEAVIASGGGLVTDRVTYDMLKQRTLTVWLKARPEDYLARVAAQGDRRPMAGRAEPLAELRELLKEREPLYAEAEVTIDTSMKTPEEITRTVIQKASMDPIGTNRL